MRLIISLIFIGLGIQSQAYNTIQPNFTLDEARNSYVRIDGYTSIGIQSRTGISTTFGVHKYFVCSSNSARNSSCNLQALSQVLNSNAVAQIATFIKDETCNTYACDIGNQVQIEYLTLRFQNGLILQSKIYPRRNP